MTFNRSMKQNLHRQLGDPLGLGLFGVADALVAMKLKYGSEKANAFMGEVMKMMLLTALRSSCDRAKKLAPSASTAGKLPSSPQSWIL